MRRLLAPILTVFSLAPAGDAHAGRQANPLPVFTRDNDRFELLYSRDGIRFEDDVYAPAGRGRYRFVREPEQCEPDRPGRVVAELRVSDRTFVLHTVTVYRGCGKGRLRKWSEVRRLLSRVPYDEASLCKPLTYSYRNRDRVVLLTDRCDGTMDLRLPGDERTLLVSYADRGRYAGFDTFLPGRGGTWSVVLRGEPGARKLRLRGTLERGGGLTERLRGAFELTHTWGPGEIRPETIGQ